MQPMQQVACMGQMQPMQAMPMPPMQPTLQPCQQSQPMGQMVPVAQPYLSMSPPTQVIFYPVSNSQVAPDSQQGHQSIQASSTAASSKTKKLRSNSSKTKSPKRSRSRSRGRRRHKHRTRSKSRERRRTRTKSKSRKGPRGHSKTKPKKQRRPETPERPPIASAASTAPESQQASAADPNLDSWGPWDSSGKRTWPNTSYQSWYGQRSGQRTPSSTRGLDDRDTQVAEAEEYNYWSQAIQKARRKYFQKFPFLRRFLPQKPILHVQSTKMKSKLSIIWFWQKTPKFLKISAIIWQRFF